MIITIREAKQEDYEELMKLYDEFIEKTSYLKHDNNSFKQVLAEPTSKVHVAVGDSKLIGFILFSTRFVVRFPKKIMQVDELFVTEEFRKHGVGQRLIEVAEEKARDLDCFHIYIESSMDRAGAHKFYEKLGYENRGYYFKKAVV